MFGVNSTSLNVQSLLKETLNVVFDSFEAVQEESVQFFSSSLT